MRKILLMTMICIGLAGCGIKPGEVDPPDAEKGQDFPVTYPDVNTDPAYPARTRTLP